MFFTSSRIRLGAVALIVGMAGAYQASAQVFYQAVQPLPCFDGNYPVVGSWLVNGYACGVGVREDHGPITQNTSRFVPHVFSK